MGELLDRVHLQKAALAKVLELNKKSNDELDIILTEIRDELEIPDDTWITISTAFSIITTRKVAGQLGVKLG